MAKKALVPGRKILCRWELFITYALISQGNWVWVCHMGISSLTAPFPSPHLEINYAGAYIKWMFFLAGMRVFIRDPETTSRDIFICPSIFIAGGENSEIWTITWTKRLGNWLNKILKLIKQNIKTIECFPIHSIKLMLLWNRTQKKT